jgi:hypothetical protein
MTTNENMPDVKNDPKAVRPVGFDIPKWGGKPEMHGSNVRQTEAGKKRKAAAHENAPPA